MLLWEELKERGFDGQSSTVRAWLGHRFGSPKKVSTGSLTKRSTPIGHQRSAWLMLKADPPKNRYLKALYRASPEISEIAHTARGLFEIIRKRDAAAWPAWLESAEQSSYAVCSAPPERPGRRRRGVATTLDQRDGRGADPPIEAYQAADVRPRRLRSTQTPSTQLGLTSALRTPSLSHTPSSPKVSQNPFNSESDIVLIRLTSCTYDNVLYRI